MKSSFFSFIMFVIIVFSACKKDGTDVIGGTQSAMGEVGTTVTASSSVAGVSSIAGSVTTLADGISTFSGSAVVSNATIKNVLSNVPGMTVSGNNVTTTGIKLKLTSEGIESITPLDPGVIVDYNSAEGDTYTGSTGAKRTVISKSTTDDYAWGMMNIKVMKIEETPNRLGVKKITYYANHRWGLVGIEFTFDDNSVAKFPLYSSASN
ncbi:MAG: hypothetical protein MUD02_11515 [Bacteroidales bacterium]|nr:hypothetical protein [Bacteroidales bacterium]